jgi:hypothetical protein
VSFQLNLILPLLIVYFQLIFQLIVLIYDHRIDLVQYLLQLHDIQLVQHLSIQLKALITDLTSFFHLIQVLLVLDFPLLKKSKF